MSHTYTNLLSHVVFSTKDREPLIDLELKSRLLDYMTGIAGNGGNKILSINAVEDHVHLLWELSPTWSVSDATRVLKTNASKWIHENWRGPFAWQTGYGAFSVSRSNVTAVANYIEHQEEHHRRRSFEEEFIELLVKHSINYDPKYLLG
jgi:REP element-mobilizing transposase RayT